MLYHSSGLNPRGYCTQLSVFGRREATWEEGDVLKEGQRVRWGLHDRDAYERHLERRQWLCCPLSLSVSNTIQVNE